MTIDPMPRLMPGLSFRVHYLYLQMIHVDYRIATTDPESGECGYQYERQSFDNVNLAVNFYLSLNDFQQGRIGTDRHVPTVDWL